MTEIPRRCYLDKLTPAELAIWEAVQAVEEAGCDTRLTDAVILLQQARERVADYVDGIQPLPAQSDGAVLITAERQRQVTAEGWTPEHDDEHIYGELARAAVSYTLLAARQANNPDTDMGALSHWPWHNSWWKPSSDPIRNLTKAGALIAAEIDRLRRASATRLTNG